ncbi:MAG: hypothetical protein HYT63_02435 [Candidatus Yanofskybacteria bacterium]|nr:hypothetical protein [Candidatus Yanofskybacteria bacterium]
MRSTSRKLGFLVFTLLIFTSVLLPGFTLAIEDACRDLFEASFEITPEEGDYPTEVTLTSNFAWLTNRKACLENTLRFDLSYESLGRQQLSGNIAEVKFKNLPGVSGGILKNGQEVTNVYKIKIKDLASGAGDGSAASSDISNYVSPGESIKFKMKVESDDFLDNGSDLSSYYDQTFKLAVTGKLCAYKEKDGATRCLPNSTKEAESNKCDEAVGTTAGENPINPNSPDSCQKLKCVPVEASVCGTGKVSSTGPINLNNLNVDIFKFKIDNPLAGKADNIIDLLAIFANFIFQLGVPVAVIIIIYSGILYLVSADRPAVVQRATNGLKYAAIGLAVLLIGKGFVSLVQSILSVN